ncbi:MAG: NfeD family protein [Flavobacteriales bacterium]
MYKWLFFLFALLAFGFASAQSKLIYQFNIKEEIAPPIWRKTKMAMDEAERLNADYVFINMNTYGGAVDAADSIRTRILQSPIPVFILIENNAASAGALISLACDSIFMQPGSTIGAATVVNQEGEQVPDKYQSYMRKKMRATAEENGRNPDIAEAMVDPDKEVEGVSEKGKVVTLTVKEAIELGFCDGEFNTMEEVLTHCGVSDYSVTKQKLSSVDTIIGWLINPAISGLLILVIIGGIYFELQSPGVGFPLIASIVAALLYFMPHYLEGLAENWEVVIFACGLILIGVEIFVIPGFGIAGISGIALAVIGLTLSMVGNVGFNFAPVDMGSWTEAFLVVMLASGVSVIGSLFLASKLFESGALSRVVLNAEQKSSEGYVGTDGVSQSLIGSTGTAYTHLHPSGKVEIDGNLHDAFAESGYIEKGTSVKVVSYSTSQIKVRAI